jgi:hypothetical protein
MYDIDFYRLLSDTEDRILTKNRDLVTMKNELAKIEKIEGFDEEHLTDLRNQISEMYLSIQYAQTLRDEMALFMPHVRMLASFADSRFDDETFNMIYEEWIGDDE